MVVADLGLSPWDVFHQGVSLKTEFTIGLVAVATSFTVLLLWIPLRERPGFGTLANAVVIGLTIDVINRVLDTPGALWAQWLLLVGGMLAVAVGSGYYIGAKLGPGPRDGLMTGLARRGYSVRFARFGVEGTVLVIGWLLGGTVGIGTLLFAVGIGPLVQFFLGRTSVK